MTKTEKLLLRHEGYRRFVYHCPAGKLTVGIGRNLEGKGLSLDEALYLLRNDIRECKLDLYKIFKNFDKLSENRQNVLIDMRFNLGFTGFRGFKKMIAAVHEENFDLAAREMVNSSWYEQVGDRTWLLTEMMLGKAR